MKNRSGLIFSGGGARGAYQAGVMAAIYEICEKSGVPIRFDFLSGVSAGAINASSLACNSENYKNATEILVKLWSQLSVDQVFSTEPLTMGKIGFKWMSELSLGSLTGTTPGRSLLDTSPLRKLIEQNLDFSKIDKNLREGHLVGLAVTAMDYSTSATVTFVQSRELLPMWDKGRKRSEKTAIDANHVMASSSIPLLFPPINVNEKFFGDGSVRNHAPCSPVIYLGANRLLVIGVRRLGKTAFEARAKNQTLAPSVARVLNALLNGALMDAIEQDIERMHRMNDYAHILPFELHEKIGLKPLDYVFISPSADIGEMAVQMSHKLPGIVRYLMKGLGSLEDASEILSYLLFDPEFCTNLIQIGYDDGLKKKEELIQHFLEPRSTSSRDGSSIEISS